MDDEQNNDDCKKHIHLPITLDRVMNSKYCPKNKYNANEKYKYQRSLSLIQRQSDHSSMQRALAQAAVRIKH